VSVTGIGVFLPERGKRLQSKMVNFLVESFGLLNDLFPFPSILDAGYQVFDLHLANVLFDVILPSVLGFSFVIFWLEVSN
jgi:hypothetical protein